MAAMPPTSSQRKLQDWAELVGDLATESALARRVSKKFEGSHHSR
jgi:hypothetical protein